MYKWFNEISFVSKEYSITLTINIASSVPSIWRWQSKRVKGWVALHGHRSQSYGGSPLPVPADSWCSLQTYHCTSSQLHT